MVMAKSAADGADTGVWLAASPEVEGKTGGLWEKRKEMPCQYRDPVEGDKLVKLLEEMAAKPAPAA
jgi:hypothetical protein